MPTGKLYCVGIGPGDPELVTLKALRAISESQVLFVPSSGPTSKRLALDIAERLLEGRAASLKEKEVIELDFPMTRDRDKLERAWRHNADQIASKVKAGSVCAYLVLGDPLLYSTFGHVHDILSREFDLHAEFVAGVSSVTACPAKSGLILAEGGESILITPAENLDLIKRNLDLKGSLVLIKGSVNFDEILRELKNSGLDDSAKLLYVRRCTMEGEQYIETTVKDWRSGLVEEDYFSMLIIAGRTR